MFTWENSHRREFHTGMTSWFRITFTWWLGFFIIPRPTCWSWRSHLRLTKIMHALPVSVYLQTEFTLKRVVVSRLHDTFAKSRTEWNSRPGARTGVNSRRGDSRRHDILWWYHVNKCRAMRGNRSELAPARKSPRCHVNTPLAVLPKRHDNSHFLPSKH